MCTSSRNSTPKRDMHEINTYMTDFNTKPVLNMTWADSEANSNDQFCPFIRAPESSSFICVCVLFARIFKWCMYWWPNPFWQPAFLETCQFKNKSGSVFREMVAQNIPCFGTNPFWCQSSNIVAVLLYEFIITVNVFIEFHSSDNGLTVAEYLPEMWTGEFERWFYNYFFEIFDSLEQFVLNAV